jgi:pimeloyl-ACP methyl ester carboxylesterase
MLFLGSRAALAPTAGDKVGSFAMEGSLIGSTIHRVDTHLGPLEVRIYGKVGIQGSASASVLPPVVCLPGMNEKLKDEWAPVASALHQKGYRVAIVHFHSNPRTAPGMVSGVKDEDVQRIVLEAVIRSSLGAEKAIVMGKSWGGKQAALFTIANPEAVSKLVAVCPASSDPSMLQSLSALPPRPPPVLLAWARDDWVTPFRKSEVWRSSLGQSLTFVETAKGGHTISPVYVDDIVRFASS